MINNLESVQLQKGASSVNYGASGIGGVVDLRTAETFGYVNEQASVEAEFGSTSRIGLQVVRVLLEGWGMSLDASTAATHNERENDDYENTTFTGRMDAGRGGSEF